MIIRSIMSRAMICALLMLVSGCLSAPPRENFYTLSSEVPKTQTSDRATSAATSISVGPVNISELVDRPQLVIRTAANRVDILEQQRWAQPLKNEIARVVAENLGALLGSSEVTAYPNNAAVADYRIALTVQQFESIPGQTATIAALWTVRRADGKNVEGSMIVNEPLSAEASADNYEGLVKAHSRALAQLSRRIASSIATISSNQ